MPVDVQYVNGPRAGRKGTLRNLDVAPATIDAKAEAKAKNMKPGIYRLNVDHLAETNVYYWRT